VAELKTQINDIVMDVLRDNSPRHFTIVDDRKPATTKGATAKSGAAKGDKAKEPAKKRAPRKTKAANAATQNSGNAASSLKPSDELIGKPCPVCGKGVIIKGRTAYGCSNWKNGCTFKVPFE
jgi:DNA topoisomerase III